MTWEEKLSALQLLCDTSLRMRKPGDWYIESQMSVIEKDHPNLLVGRYGEGTTPKEALLDHWEQVILGPDVECIVVHGNTDRERRVRWNGFMWQDYVE